MLNLCCAPLYIAGSDNNTVVPNGREKDLRAHFSLQEGILDYSYIQIYRGLLIFNNSV